VYSPPRKYVHNFLIGRRFGYTRAPPYGNRARFILSRVEALISPVLPRFDSVPAASPLGSNPPGSCITTMRTADVSRARSKIDERLPFPARRTSIDVRYADFQFQRRGHAIRGFRGLILRVLPGAGANR